MDVVIVLSLDTTYLRGHKTWMNNDWRALKRSKCDINDKKRWMKFIENFYYIWCLPVQYLSTYLPTSRQFVDGFLFVDSRLKICRSKFHVNKNYRTIVLKKSPCQRTFIHQNAHLFSQNAVNYENLKFLWLPKCQPTFFSTLPLFLVGAFCKKNARLLQ